ncbi:MAG: type II toxin-antitoxin system HicB family antitoxin [Nitrospirae bacterium]|nr:MAG: type II toxin-antitoxin system HicB family antitoxin [Nitrospirota bacterium]
MRRTSKAKSFTLEYWKSGKWYVGRLQEIPSVLSQGGTLKELEQNIQDAYQLYMEERRSQSRPKAKSKPIALST